MSKARAEEFLREDRAGAKALWTIMADRARYTNLLLLLRLACELTATVLVTIVARVAVRRPLAGAAADRRRHDRHLLRRWSASGRARSAASTSTGSRWPAPARCGCSAGCSTRWPRCSSCIGNAITPGRGLRDGPFASEVELRELVDMAEERGVVEHDERQMIQSVFDLGDTIAREVMVPRTEVVWIERGKTVRQALALALRSGFSRIPVVGENVDDVVGVVYLKDLARRAQDAERARTTPVEEVMRTVAYVPESKPVDELLREMQAARSHIAIVIDEYGGTAGLITIEDILEEIVGEITDEYDVERAPDRAHRRRHRAGHRPAGGRGPRRAVRRRAARPRRRRDGRRPAGRGAGPGADPGRDGRRARPRAHGRGRRRAAQPHRHRARAPRVEPATPTAPERDGEPAATDRAPSRRARSLEPATGCR